MDTRRSWIRLAYKVLKWGEGGEDRFGLPEGAVAAVVIVRWSCRSGEAIPPSAMKARQQMHDNKSNGCGDA